MPADGRLILVSGGGWAVGDLGGAAEVALAADPAARVVSLCGRSETIHRHLSEAFALAPRAKVVGFTERMPELLAAADVLIHSTAGLTAFEARIRGCQLISYGWGVAHIRLNNEAYERFGLAEVAPDRSSLADALVRALQRPRTADLAYGERPSAAAEVLALAGGEQCSCAAQRYWARVLARPGRCLPWRRSFRRSLRRLACHAAAMAAVGSR